MRIKVNRVLKCLFFSVVVSFFLYGESNAETYKWVDDAGKFHVTDDYQKVPKDKLEVEKHIPEMVNPREVALQKISAQIELHRKRSAGIKEVKEYGRSRGVSEAVIQEIIVKKYPPIKGMKLKMLQKLEFKVRNENLPVKIDDVTRKVWVRQRDWICLDCDG